MILKPKDHAEFIVSKFLFQWT